VVWGAWFPRVAGVAETPARVCPATVQSVNHSLWFR
jgi:hypothetical protein